MRLMRSCVVISLTAFPYSAAKGVRRLSNRKTAKAGVAAARFWR
jgi:hypothetical protein